MSDLSGSETESPPLTDEAGDEEEKPHDVLRQPHEPKPCEREGEWVLRDEVCPTEEEILAEVQDRIKVLEWKERTIREGKKVHGEATLDKANGKKMMKAGMLNSFTSLPLQEDAMIGAAWKAEDHGWTKIICILDSGASESVCPPDMCPSFPIVESPGSRAGVHYASASGGRIANKGQQKLPVWLDNGEQTVATFQVAEVTRPLFSVARLCERGNRVLFGRNGGVIKSLETGRETKFYRQDGVYLFEMWVPPPSECPGFSGLP